MEMESPVGRRIDRMSSIEKEPRTLCQDQIEFAREAALYVVSTRSIEEASSIFTAGLEPVVSARKGESRSLMDLEEEYFASYVPDRSQWPGRRDTASAPF